MAAPLPSTPVAYDGATGLYQWGTGLARFRTIVLADPALQGQLRGLPSRAQFVGRVVELAERAGCPVTEADVEEALTACRRSWLERWI